MTVSGGEPGQELAGTDVAPARQAASIILLRGGEETLELLLVQRTPRARFMGGVWVFPGGAVDMGDTGSEAGSFGSDAAHRAAAVRELEEEASVGGIAPEALVKFSQWITPEQVKIRFDTHFFLAEAPPGAAPRIDGEECVDLGWFTPAGALRAGEAGEIALVFPTIKHLEQLSVFPSTAAVLAHAAAHEVVPVLPKVVMGGETARVLLPGEPGYDTA